jgi:hypothetical protein
MSSTTIPGVSARSMRRNARTDRTSRTETRRMLVELILAAAMLLAATLLGWGSTFARNMVHDQLSDQKISFPAAGPGLSKAEYPGLQRYAGRPVDSGPKAKAYANEFIAVHLKAVNGGQTYSQTSGAAMAARKAATEATAAKASNAPALVAAADKLDAQTQTLFRGETLRGLLLYAWGWSLVGQIALYVAVVAAFGGFALVALALRRTVPYTLINGQ